MLEYLYEDKYLVSNIHLLYGCSGCFARSKERDWWTNLLIFVGRWSAVDLCCWHCISSIRYLCLDVILLRRMHFKFLFLSFVSVLFYCFKEKIYLDFFTTLDGHFKAKKWSCHFYRAELRKSIALLFYCLNKTVKWSTMLVDFSALLKASK